MRYAVFSDVHANEAALRRAIADAAAQGAETFVCLGDVVGYGPMPAETVALVRETCRIAVAGNHDDAVSGRGDASAFNDLAGDAAVRHRDALSRDAVAYLASLPYVCRFGGAVAAHGDLSDPPSFGYVEDEDSARATFAATDAQIVFTGHTHVPCIFLTGASGRIYRTEPQDFSVEDGKRYIVNPGSVGYPRESGGRCLSSYAIYDDAEGTVEFRFLPFSVASVMQRGRGVSGRMRRVAAALAAALLAALAAAAFFAARWSGAPQEERPVAAKTIALSGGERFLFPNLVLDRKAGSPPATLRVSFVDGGGKTIRSSLRTVRESAKAAMEIPAAARGAAKVEVAVLATPGGEAPAVLEFAPEASSDGGKSTRKTPRSGRD